MVKLQKSDEEKYTIFKLLAGLKDGDSIDDILMLYGKPQDAKKLI